MVTAPLIMDLGVIVMKMIKIVFLSVMMLFASVAYSGQVNINQADASTLASELSGIGDKKAQEIVDYRLKNGPFSSIDDLQKVKGISVKTIEKNRQNLTL